LINSKSVVLNLFFAQHYSSHNIVLSDIVVSVFTVYQFNLMLLSFTKLDHELWQTWHNIDSLCLKCHYMPVNNQPTWTALIYALSLYLLIDFAEQFW